MGVCLYLFERKRVFFSRLIDNDDVVQNLFFIHSLNSLRCYILIQSHLIYIYNLHSARISHCSALFCVAFFHTCQLLYRKMGRYID